MESPILKKYDLIIIGLGPVGLFAANVFGAKGWKVLAIEQYAHSWKYPRAIGMDDEILRAIQSIGLLNKILPRTNLIRGLQLLHRDNEVFYTTASPKEGDFERGPYLFYQPELEAILEEGTTRYPNVTLRYNCQLKSILKNEEIVIIECGEKDNFQSIEPIQCQFLLGCDGAKSTLRQLLQIEEKDLNYAGYILKVDAKAKDLNKITFNKAFAQKYCSTKRAWVRMVGRDDHCRWEFQFKGKNVNPELLSDESALSYIQAAGDDIENLKLINTAFYQYRSVVQKKWRKGRAIIAGDAAHLTAPYIGQGMCAGFRDIVNLSWKLAAIYKNELSTKLLTTYRSERAPHITHLIKVAMVIGYLFKTRWYYLLLMLKKIPFIGKYGEEFNPPIPKLGKGFFASHRRARGIFPQFKLYPSADKLIYSDDWIGEKWALVSLEKLSEKEFESAQHLGVEGFQISEALDKNHKVKTWFRQQKLKVVLLRPDKYIFAAGQDAVTLLTAFQSMRNQYAA